MLIWLSLSLFLLGLLALRIDRRAAWYFRAHSPRPLFRVAWRITDLAKGGPWIGGAALLYLAAQIAMAEGATYPALYSLSDYALALLASFVVGSVVLHAIKIFLGRRRPRDDAEHGLYGFRYFTWGLQYDSFPSGHAMTIFSVAVVASAILPALAPLWFVLAAALAATREMLTSHFISDVAIGSALGVLATRETLLLAFPALTPGWF